FNHELELQDLLFEFFKQTPTQRRFLTFNKVLSDSLEDYHLIHTEQIPISYQLLLNFPEIEVHLRDQGAPENYRSQWPDF
ncbi:hypothetical protein KQ721_15465, partial [Listeria monocytogenes]|nr:hypothetical protein [Listeria monocytogenes]